MVIITEKIILGSGEQGEKASLKKLYSVASTCIDKIKFIYFKSEQLLAITATPTCQALPT